jgi:uncharacterized membrane protein
MTQYLWDHGKITSLLYLITLFFFVETIYCAMSEQFLERELKIKSRRIRDYQSEAQISARIVQGGPLSCVLFFRYLGLPGSRYMFIREISSLIN